MKKNLFFCAVLQSLPFLFGESLLEALQPPPKIEQNFPLQRDKKLSLDFINETLRIMYAPAQWKSDSFGWDREKEYEKLIYLLETTPHMEITEFRKKLHSFVQTTRDYHTNIHFHSTEYATLPFHVRTAEGRVFISSVRADISPLIPLHVGDELLSFDGKPVFEVLQTLIDEAMNGGSKETDLALAAMMLTRRRGSTAIHVPQGSVKIEINSKAAQGKATYLVPWDYHKEQIAPKDKVGADKPRKIASLRDYLYSNPLVSKKSLLPIFKDIKFLHDKMKEEEAHQIGAKKSFLPFLGPPLWVFEGDHFYAYLYKNSFGKLVGYVRIPYYVDDPFQSAPTPMDELGDIIEFFELFADALVVDQLHNPGGNLFNLYDIASMLTPRPLKTIPQHFKLTPAEVDHSLQLLDLLDMLEDVSSLLLLAAEDKEFVRFFANARDYCHFILDQWQGGKSFTDLYYFLGISEVVPNSSVHFSKPIVMVIDELDFSCGDLMPAIMQDNGRAILFGARTAGAGGAVEEMAFPNNCGIDAFSYTTSFLVRDNGLPIENLGVSPDVAVNITAIDLQENYREYCEKLNATVTKAIADN